MKKKILITAKTYPTLSDKYEESVCTVGIDESGQFIRVYPIPFRELPYGSQYKKYDWIELQVKKNKSDFRPESFQPESINSSIKILKNVGTDSNWLLRKQLLLHTRRFDLTELINEAKDPNKYTSIAFFKPKELIRFHITTTSEQWNEKQKAILSQERLFQKQTEIIKKVPYNFTYEFIDVNDRKSILMILDWEVSELYWNCLKKYEGDRVLALEDINKKLWDDFAFKRDLHFFLGTTRGHHLRAKNPFLIIGLFYPIKEDPSLFDQTI